MTDLVTIKLMDSSDDREVAALFSSTGVPKDSNYSLERDESKEIILKAVDQITSQQYIGSADKISDYYIGVRKRGVLEVHPLSMYRMIPIIEITDRNSRPDFTPLTFKEQLDEMKEKFGSRKTQRSLASKRKYAVQFGEEDVQQIEEKTQEITDSAINQSANELTINDSLDILPKQNRDSICVEEVYDLNEIIVETERNVLTQFEAQLFQQIDNSFIKSLITNTNDSENKLIANYISIVISMMALNGSTLRKANPLPSLDPEVKDVFFDRYLTTQMVNRKTKYMISAKQKDRLLIHGIILCLILNKFRPIELEALQKAFKVPLKNLRKIIEIIGAYIEIMKTSSGVNTKSIVLRIPLNTLTINEKKPFKRR